MEGDYSNGGGFAQTHQGHHPNYLHLPTQTSGDDDQNYLVLPDSPGYLKTIGERTSLPASPRYHREPVAHDVAFSHEFVAQVEAGGSAAKRDTPIHLAQAKVVLLGSVAAGKTSLLNSLRYGESRLVPEGPDGRTIGIEVHSVALRPDTKLWFYDFGGHDTYHFSQQLFLTQRAIYLLAVDVSIYDPVKFEKTLRHWYTILTSRLVTPVICLLATHIDECYDRTNMAQICQDMHDKLTQMENAHRAKLEQELQALKNEIMADQSNDPESIRRFQPRTLRQPMQRLNLLLTNRPRIFHSVCCISNKTMEGMDRFRQDLVSIVTDNESLFPQKDVPQSWIDLSEAIGSMKDDVPFVTMTEFMEISQKFCIVGDHVQRVLSYLQSVGLVLHYQDYRQNSDLSKYVFVNPNLLLAIFGLVFNHNYFMDETRFIWKHKSILRLPHFDFVHLRKNLKERGIIGEKLLKCFWDAMGISDEVYQAIVPLLEKFDLCYEIRIKPGDAVVDGRHFLFPYLMNKRKPPEVDFMWSDDLLDNFMQCGVELAFTQSALPFGFLEKVLIRAHTYVDHCLSWKQGMVAFCDEGQDLVRVESKVGPDGNVILYISARVRSDRKSMARHIILLLVAVTNRVLLHHYPGVVAYWYCQCAHCLVKSLEQKYSEVKVDRFPADNIVYSSPGDMTTVQCINCPADRALYLEDIFPREQDDIHKLKRLMSEPCCRALKASGPALIKHMSYRDVMNALLRKQLLNIKQAESIGSKANHEDRAQQLLMYLTQCDQKAFDVLCDELKQSDETAWLAEELLVRASGRNAKASKDSDSIGSSFLGSSKKGWRGSQGSQGSASMASISNWSTNSYGSSGSYIRRPYGSYITREPIGNYRRSASAASTPQQVRRETAPPNVASEVTAGLAHQADYVRKPRETTVPVAQEKPAPPRSNKQQHRLSHINEFPQEGAQVPQHVAYEVEVATTAVVQSSAPLPRPTNESPATNLHHQPAASHETDLDAQIIPQSAVEVQRQTRPRFDDAQIIPQSVTEIHRQPRPRYDDEIDIDAQIIPDTRQKAHPSPPPADFETDLDADLVVPQKQAVPENSRDQQRLPYQLPPQDNSQMPPDLPHRSNQQYNPGQDRQATPTYQQQSYTDPERQATLTYQQQMVSEQPNHHHPQMPSDLPHRSNPQSYTAPERQATPTNQQQMVSEQPNHHHPQMPSDLPYRSNPQSYTAPERQPTPTYPHQMLPEQPNHPQQNQHQYPEKTPPENHHPQTTHSQKQEPQQPIVYGETDLDAPMEQVIPRDVRVRSTGDILGQVQKDDHRHSVPEGAGGRRVRGSVSSSHIGLPPQGRPLGRRPVALIGSADLGPTHVLQDMDPIELPLRPMRRSRSNSLNKSIRRSKSKSPQKTTPEDRHTWAVPYDWEQHKSMESLNGVDKRRSGGFVFASSEMDVRRSIGPHKRQSSPPVFTSQPTLAVEERRFSLPRPTGKKTGALPKHEYVEPLAVPETFAVSQSAPVHRRKVVQPVEAMNNTQTRPPVHPQKMSAQSSQQPNNQKDRISPQFAPQNQAGAPPRPFSSRMSDSSDVTESYHTGRSRLGSDDSDTATITSKMSELSYDSFHTVKSHNPSIASRALSQGSHVSGRTIDSYHTVNSDIPDDATITSDVSDLTIDSFHTFNSAMTPSNRSLASPNNADFTMVSQLSNVTMDSFQSCRMSDDEVTLTSIHSTSPEPPFTVDDTPNKEPMRNSDIPRQEPQVPIAAPSWVPQSQPQPQPQLQPQPQPQRRVIPEENAPPVPPRRDLINQAAPPIPARPGLDATPVLQRPPTRSVTFADDYSPEELRRGAPASRAKQAKTVPLSRTDPQWSPGALGEVQPESGKDGKKKSKKKSKKGEKKSKKTLLPYVGNQLEQKTAVLNQRGNGHNAPSMGVHPGQMHPDGILHNNNTQVSDIRKELVENYVGSHPRVPHPSQQVYNVQAPQNGDQQRQMSMRVDPRYQENLKPHAYVQPYMRGSPIDMANANNGNKSMSLDDKDGYPYNGGNGNGVVLVEEPYVPSRQINDNVRPESDTARHPRMNRDRPADRNSPAANDPNYYGGPMDTAV